MGVTVSEDMLKRTTRCVKDLRCLCGTPEDLCDVSFLYGAGIDVMVCTESQLSSTYSTRLG
jgi:hypothetical protein